jgi:hypothetical protein
VGDGATYSANRRGGTASTGVVLTISVPEQQKNAHDKHAEAVSQLPWRARSQELPRRQTQIERSYVNQLPFQNVLPSPQMAAPHAARLVAMRKAAFDHLPAPSQ